MAAHVRDFSIDYHSNTEAQYVREGFIGVAQGEPSCTVRVTFDCDLETAARLKDILYGMQDEVGLARRRSDAAEPCCERDHDRDGNCDRHRALPSGAKRLGPAR